MFGFPVPEEFVKEHGQPSRYWGCRALFNHGVCEILGDRTQTSLEPGDESIIEAHDTNAIHFFEWINEHGLPQIRMLAKNLSRDSSEVVTFGSSRYTIMGSPKNSYGYFYIGAWQNPPLPDPHVRFTGDLLSPPDAKWSGKGPVPIVGGKVKVIMNNMGKGTVVSYFVQEGYLGVRVKLHKPPAWFKKQNKFPYADVFGIEIAVPEQAF